MFTLIQIGSPDPIPEQALRLFTDTRKGAATAGFNGVVELTLRQGLAPENDIKHYTTSVFC